MGLRERISTASLSGNLGERINGLADVDVIRAMGVVSTRQPLGVRIFRLRHARDARELAEIVGGLRKVVADQYPDMIWANVSTTVERALKHWLTGACESCQGRGYQLVPNAPVLSENMCLDCAGQGRVALQAATEAETWLVDRLSEYERNVSSAIARLLRDDDDQSSAD